MATRIQLRRDTAANWETNNPILASGEIGFETDTKLQKIGDGNNTPWNELEYLLDINRINKEISGTYNCIVSDKSKFLEIRGGETSITIDSDLFPIGTQLIFRNTTWGPHTFQMTNGKFYSVNGKYTDDQDITSLIIPAARQYGFDDRWDEICPIILTAEEANGKWTITYNDFRSVEPYSIDYATLVDKINNGQLIPEQKYLIDNYCTARAVAGDSTNTASFQEQSEPLIVKAISSDALYNEAYSALYPEDIIHYSIDPPIECDSDENNMQFAHFGHITYREDTRYAICCDFDFRGVKNRRWQTTSNSGIYTSMSDTGFGYVDKYTFENTRTPLFTRGIKQQSSSVRGADGSMHNRSYLPNIILGSGCSYITFGCGNNRITIGNMCSSIVFGVGCSEVTFGTNCNTMTFGSGCGYMNFGDSCNYMNFGNNCQSISFGSSCSYMIFGTKISYSAPYPYDGDTNNLTFEDNTSNVYCQTGDSYSTTLYSNSTAKYGNGKYFIDCDDSPENIQLSLPPVAKCRGAEIYVKRIDANYAYQCKISVTDSAIDGQEDIYLTQQYQSVTLFSDGNRWHIL